MSVSNCKMVDEVGQIHTIVSFMAYAKHLRSHTYNYFMATVQLKWQCPTSTRKICANCSYDSV